MIIPKIRVCDICGTQLTRNIRYYQIKSKEHISASGGECNYNLKHDVCKNCMEEFKTWLIKKEREHD